MRSKKTCGAALFMFAALCVLLNCISAVYGPATAARLLSRGEAALHKSNFEAAVGFYSRAIPCAPRNEAAWYGRGVADFRLCRYDDAIADANEAIRLRPYASPAFLCLRAAALCEKGDYQRAAADFDASLQAQARRLHVLSARQRVPEIRGATTRQCSITTARSCCGPTANWPLSGRANLFTAKGDYAAAIGAFTNALQRRPDFAEALCRRARHMRRSTNRPAHAPTS